MAESTTTATYTVTGMTCQHCVTSVTEEISMVRTAVIEAGYQAGQP